MEQALQDTLRLHKALAAWGGEDFAHVLKQEIAQIEPAALPLQQALAHGNYVAEGSGFQPMIISVTEEPECIRAKVGIFYAGVVMGCACANDPTPEQEHTEYCVLEFRIDRHSAATRVKLLAE